MSSKNEKKERKMRRIMIQNEIEQNETMVLEEVTKTLIKSKFIVRLLFTMTILFKKEVKK